MNRLDEIKARLKAATPGPWEPVVFNDGLWNECMGVRGPNPYRENQIEPFAMNQWFCHSAEDGDKATESSYANMRLMGHAPSDLAYLLSALESAEKVVEAARVVVSNIEAFYYKNKPLELNPLAKSLAAHDKEVENINAA